MSEEISSKRPLFTNIRIGYTVLMKNKTILILVCLLAALAFFGCNGNRFGSSKVKENFDKDASYALGMSIGSSLANDGIFPNIDEFLKGVKDSLYGEKTRLTENEAMEKIQSAYFAMMEVMEAESMQKGMEFLAENSKNPGVVITSSGLQYEVITEADGPKPMASDTVRVHYEGRLIDDTVFDSSLERGYPIEFPLDGVIPGWTEGLQLMSVGSKYKLYIPPELGYGPGGAGPIPPNSVLIFEVELIDIL